MAHESVKKRLANIRKTLKVACKSYDRPVAWRHMTIPIKIECGCGQRYAFDVEPVNGRLGAAVACPACGTDGTMAANAFIAQKIPQSPSSREPVMALLVETPSSSEAPAPAPRNPQPGQLDSTKAEAEARSKISWGDPPEEAVKCLMMHGFTHPDATASVRIMVQQRTISLRKIGIWKIIIGTALIPVPVVVYLILAHFHFIFFKLLAIAIMVGLWGAWMAFRGMIMVFAPALEKGDLADL